MKKTIYTIDTIGDLLPLLPVDYKDQSVLSTESQDLDLVNYFFESITCGDKDIERLLYEVIGYSLAKTCVLSKAFIFKGNGRNGKSKIFRIIEALLGNDLCSHEHLEKLSGPKAGGKSTIKNLENATVNISEDQKQPKYVNTSLITRAISGEPISLGGIEDMTPYATLLFSVNEVIDFKETGIYITDRFVVIPFNATFTDYNNNRYVNIGEELCKQKPLQIIATRAINAFVDVLNNGKFTIPAVVEEATNNYFMECNNVAEFCSLYPIKQFIAKSIYYREYCTWCNYNNKESVSNTRFGKEVLNLGYRAERYSFKNDRKTYYTAPDFDNNEAQEVYKQYLSDSGISEESAQKYTEKELMDTFGNSSFAEYQTDLLYSNSNSE